jgi:excisionase family DNA binding protein
METTETAGDSFVAPPLLTVGEAAKLARVSRTHMWRLCDRGEVLAVRVGDSSGPLRIPTEQFLAWLYGASGGDESRPVNQADLEPWLEEVEVHDAE